MAKRGLVVVLAVLGLLLGRPTPSLATVLSCYFTPTSGGPGTVLHISCSEVYGPAVVNLIVAQETAGPGGTLTKFQRIGTPLGTIQPDPQGKTESQGTVVIPGRLPDGTPITARHLGILYTDKSGNRLPELDVKPFEFVPTVLPTTGRAEPFGWLLSIIAAMLTTVGLLVRRQVIS